MVEALEHADGLPVAHELEFRISLEKHRDASGVIGLHVVDHQIVDGQFLVDAVDMGEKIFHKADLHCVDKSRLFVSYNIGIIADAVRKRPEPFKPVGDTVIDAHIVDVGRDFAYIHNVGLHNCCNDLASAGSPLPARSLSDCKINHKLFPMQEFSMLLSDIIAV